MYPTPDGPRAASLPIPEPEKPLRIRAHTIHADALEALLASLHQTLIAFGNGELYDPISYCIRELIENAERANRKRRVFRAAGLDLNQPEDYARGLALLQEDAVGEVSAEEDGSFVDVEIDRQPEQLVIRVGNSAHMVETERQRVNHRLAAGQLYESIDEIFDQVADDTESAGLGLVMLRMILRRLGVPDYGVQFTSADGYTAFTITLPVTIVSDEQSDELSETLTREIKAIPQVPRSIHALRELLDDKHADFSMIASLIRRDPALMMEVLRMANSPVYRRSQRIDRCEIAVSLLGVRGLRGLLDSFGARRALEQRYDAAVLERIWNHSEEIASLAAAIGRYVNLPEDVIEAAYIGGLLHDVGRIILNGRNPDAYTALQTMCAQKGASPDAIESLIAGSNHTRIGARMAEHWNLPGRLVQAIRYSRAPLSAPEDARDCAKLIYLAHPVARRHSGAPKEYDADDAVLASFGYDIPGGLDALAAIIDKPSTPETP